MAVNMKNGVFWDVTLCGSYKNQHSSEMSVPSGATSHHIPEGGIPDFILHLNLYIT
jgi:hypothetical protein